MSDKNVIGFEDDLLIPECSEEQFVELIDLVADKTDPTETKFVILDANADYSVDKWADRMLVPSVVDEDKAETMLDFICNHVFQRLIFLSSKGSSNLDHYNKNATKDRLPYVIVFVNEPPVLKATKSDVFIDALVNNDNAGIYFIYTTDQKAETLDNDGFLSLFRVMDYEEVVSDIKALSIERWLQ